MNKKRGIYLVANLKSQSLCENLIYSIRQSGCQLPIRLIHYGGEKIDSIYITGQVEFVETSDFPEAALDFIDRIQVVLQDCPRGFLYRFLAWFGDWDEFIYSDNDIVALLNWEQMFDYMPGNCLVHADEEYRTEGRFNHNNPQFIKELFGRDALEKAFTAGHFASIKDDKLISDLDRAIEWFKIHPDVPKKHDQALLHIASLIGNWNAINLCKPPTSWLTTWAGDYKNTAAIIHAIQAGKNGRKISHIHYSGRNPDGVMPVDDLLFSNLDYIERLNRLVRIGLRKLTGLDYLKLQRKRMKRVVNHLFK